MKRINTVYIDELMVWNAVSALLFAKKMKPTMMYRMKYAKMMIKTGTDLISTCVN